LARRKIAANECEKRIAPSPREYTMRGRDEERHWEEKRASVQCILKERIKNKTPGGRKDIYSASGQKSTLQEGKLGRGLFPRLQGTAYS